MTTEQQNLNRLLEAGRYDEYITIGLGLGMDIGVMCGEIVDRQELVSEMMHRYDGQPFMFMFSVYILGRSFYYECAPESSGYCGHVAKDWYVQYFAECDKDTRYLIEGQTSITQDQFISEITKHLTQYVTEHFESIQ